MWTMVGWLDFELGWTRWAALVTGIALVLGLLTLPGAALASDAATLQLTPPEECRFLQENISDFICEEAALAGSAVLLPPYPPDDVIVGVEIAIY